MFAAKTDQTWTDRKWLLTLARPLVGFCFTFVYCGYILNKFAIMKACGLLHLCSVFVIEVYDDRFIYVSIMDIPVNMRKTI